MNDNYIIRDIKETDWEEILTIFNYFATETFAVYCEIPLTLDQFIEQSIVHLVIEDNKKIIGYGYISNFHPYPNFNHTAVLTYFILPEYTGKGLGTKLFNELIARGLELGITNYLAHICSRNEQSLNFHKKLGFEEVGRFKNVAEKFNEPFDMVWVQKQMTGKTDNE